MDLNDFEPLGSNCEFGFVLKENYDYRPSLFRWTSIDINGLIRMFDARFDGCFDADVIRPHVDKLVKNSRYDWYFHSILGEASASEFTRPGKHFERLFVFEQARVSHEVNVFTERLRRGGLCCVYSAPAVSDREALALRDAIDRFAGNPTNSLLVVTPPREETATAGTIKAFGERGWHGTVRWLAPFDQTDAADYATWHTLLSQWRGLPGSGVARA